MRRRRPPSALPVVLFLAGAAGAGYTVDASTFDAALAMLPASGCDIKGNVSINTGERIYHMPARKITR